MYSGVRQELGPSQSPVDLFHAPFEENANTFPLLKELQMIEQILNPGDCMFVPAWWWIQRQTVKTSASVTYSTDEQGNQKEFHTNGELDSIVVELEF